MWIMPLHLHVNQNSDYDDEIFFPIFKFEGIYMAIDCMISTCRDNSHFFFKCVYYRVYSMAGIIPH